MINNKILIISPAWIGDMIMAQSLFMLLRKQYPEVALEVLAPAWTHALLARMPEVNTTWLMPIGAWTTTIIGTLSIGEIFTTTKL